MKELGCLDCGLPYKDFALDVVLPDSQWAMISGRADGGGVMCPNCMVGRAAVMSGVTVAFMSFDGLPFA